MVAFSGANFSWCHFVTFFSVIDICSSFEGAESRRKKGGLNWSVLGGNDEFANFDDSWPSRVK